MFKFNGIFAIISFLGLASATGAAPSLITDIENGAIPVSLPLNGDGSRFRGSDGSRGEEADLRSQNQNNQEDDPRLSKEDNNNAKDDLLQRHHRVKRWHFNIFCSNTDCDDGCKRDKRPGGKCYSKWECQCQ